jgi:Domain of unknown function (DUF4070)/Radical SAM superfamily
MAMTADTCNVLMIYPRSRPGSFWDYQATCDLLDTRCPAAPLSLITVAALLPKSWEVRFVDCNAEPLTEGDLAWAELVMTGAMLPHQADTLRIIDLCRVHGIPVVVGGPDATSSPQIYGAANFLVLGEAEEIMADFISAWRSGARQGTFRAPMGKTDVTKSPIPRFDLLKLRYYMRIGIQFSRGCPFNCEFCDIIELYGRVPRSKTNQQILAELDTLYALGYRGHVDFVDDNLIGNKKALRKLLPDLQNWMSKKKYPFEFSTEASINLSDDRELMQAMVAANFFGVFVGIESPDPLTLVATKKKQNTRRSLHHSIHKIYDAGMIVFGGFILGFDSEAGSIAESMIACIEDTAIPVCMVGLLYALPTTQLGRRMAAEGRLFPHSDMVQEEGDQCTVGLNFVTRRPRSEVFKDFKAVLNAVYDPAAYFARVRRVGRRLRRGKRRFKMPLWMALRDGRGLCRLAWRLPQVGPTARREFGKTVLYCLLHNPRALPFVLMMSALSLHLIPFARWVIAQIDRRIADPDFDRLRAPVPPPVEAQVLSDA